MSSPERPTDVIEDRVSITMETGRDLESANRDVERAMALRRLVVLERKSAEEVVARMKQMEERYREAREQGRAFMPGYTREVRSEAERLAVDPTEYAALRTKLDINLESLS